MMSVALATERVDNVPDRLGADTHDDRSPVPSLPRLPHGRRSLVPRPPLIGGGDDAIDLVLALAPAEAIEAVCGELVRGGRFRPEDSPAGASPDERLLRARGGSVLSQLVPGSDLVGHIEDWTGLRVGHVGGSPQNLRVRAVPAEAGGTRVSCVPSWDDDGRAPTMLAADLGRATREWARTGVLLHVGQWYRPHWRDRPDGRPLRDLQG